MKTEFPEEDDLVLCEVQQTVGTSVFVKILEYGKEGVISFSEVAPGRIRNIRDFVKPGQQIVCKVLRINEERGNIELSLRRVTLKEKKEVMSNHKREKDLKLIIKLATNEETRALGIIESIKEKQNVIEFLRELLETEKENDKKAITRLKAFGLKEKEALEILKRIKEKVKERETSVRIKASVRSDESDGIDRIKTLLGSVANKNVEITYVGAPYYFIAAKGKNLKETSKAIKNVASELEQQSKKHACVVEIKER